MGASDFVNVLFFDFFFFEFIHIIYRYYNWLIFFFNSEGLFFSFRTLFFCVLFNCFFLYFWCLKWFNFIYCEQKMFKIWEKIIFSKKKCQKITPFKVMQVILIDFRWFWESNFDKFLSSLLIEMAADWDGWSYFKWF